LVRAVQLAEKLCEAGASLIEAGTPLIKAWGLYSVVALRRVCPNAEIVADLKTMDTGALEAQLARSFGADRATVLAAADIETIVDFVNEPKKLGLKSVVDSIGVGSTRLFEVVDRVKPDYVLVHTSIDAQTRRGLDMDYIIQILNKLRNMGLRVGVAGGINLERAKALSGSVDFVVVGRAIVNADDPVKAYQEFIAALS